ncbi:hypothetical protein [Flavobacterium piscis]|uniref:Ser-tRNA(Ala) deacylase AlaX n=1 Tax=Flavobacterium piscis TaxID=1114874 RepID=A0ABU1YC24_9FLAO|nr:hypothetical protein [Flavobacterium piscis]MDR7210961.1 Ser-tRNA(Ala) deacylase AlaX [Flavobacterium piscis]
MYSKENIYKNTGQFDKIVSVTFRFNSDSHKKYGPYIVGKFYYTPKERAENQHIVNNPNHEHTHGLIKFIASDSPEISHENKEYLKFDGLETSNIIEILGFNAPAENKFIKTELRDLPTPMTINSSFTKEDDADDMMLWLNNQRLKNGYKLIKEEMNQHNAILYRKYENRIIKPEEIALFRDSKTSQIKPELNYYYLNSKLEHGTITDEELEELKKLIDQNAVDKIQIIKQELEKSSEKWKKMGIDQKAALSILVQFAIHFETHRLTSGKIPIWWDFERFVHIFMRHVNETKIGERFEIKTVFQYRLKDIKSLIKIVLGIAEKEINRHFDTKPGIEFKRQGERGIYFDGDYYSFRIDKDGKLMTFHKN